MTAPAMREKIRTIRARGGKVIVIDPRRTETARHASEHVAIRPGGDAYLLLGMLNVIFAEGRVRLGRLDGRCDGLGELRDLAGQWSPERAAPHAGVEAGEIERLAREFADAPSAVAYGRVGVCHQQTGSLTHWLINALNTVTGNMDNVGGAMFPSSPFDLVTITERLDGKPGRGRLPPACKRPARARGRAPGGRAGGRDPHPRRRPGAGHVHLRRQPGALDARRRTAGQGHGATRVVCGRGHVRHRDDQARRRDPPAGGTARALGR